MPRSLPDPLLPRHPLAVRAAVAALVAALMRVLVVPVLIGNLFDRVLAAGEFGHIIPVLLVGGAMTAAGALALFLQDALFGRLAATVAAQWREAVYGRLLARDALLGGSTSGGLASRVIADLRECEIHLQYGLSSLVAETATVLLIVAWLFLANWQATLVLIILAVPLALVLSWLGRRVESSSDRVLTETETVGAHLQEGLGQLEVARSFGLGRFLGSRLHDASSRLRQEASVRALWAGAQTPAAQVLGYLALAVLILLLTGSVRDGRMSLGELTSYVTLIALLSTPLTLLPRAWAMYRQAAAAAVRLRELHAAGGTEREQVPVLPAQPAFPARTGLLRLDGLRFRFPGSGHDLFGPLTLTLPETGLVVLAGESGSGKSTLLRLLLGLLRPTAGSVVLNDTELSALPDSELRRLIGYVPQQAALFRASLLDNLDLGRGFSPARIRTVLGTVGLGSLERELPGGLDYVLQERGAGLSGGQLQRMALARALLGGPAVLLLDEPTASLDAASEAGIAQLLKEQARERLVLASAHRPALFGAAALVLELRDGQLHIHPARPEKGAAHGN